MPPIDFTPTSGVEFYPSGLMAIGMEAFYVKGSPVASEANISDRAVMLPYGNGPISLCNGTVSLRPPAPQISGGFFGGGIKTFYEVGLFVIYLDGQEIYRAAPACRWEPVTIPIQPIIIPGPFQAIRIHFEQAGIIPAGAGANDLAVGMEMAIVGRWK